MENNQHPEKKILTPSVIHDDLSEVKKPEHLRKTASGHDDLLPENPERNYHHEEFKSLTSSHDEIKHADDDVWNGEDA
ncbi:hypothetical protein EV200_1098 [Pedobacter psychrotolerans]|uniref:Uncharacterized protein n=1 Tax=Pedobacter psychrotolerans TaxID=1843235 RepID=A0A4R2H3U6_9SPHI|nr:hypothetical protein [Pedobacter psychrotolerans]TCO19826.1 hypothetical protein EV200_1098 [Pedobacter psychrotolerans]GGE49157.1 hypothetical protein GCM10011413_14140 [Pedobacter psychrotolerans]